MYQDQVRTAAVHKIMGALGVGNGTYPGGPGSVVQSAVDEIVSRCELAEPDGTRADYAVWVSVNVTRSVVKAPSGG